MWEKFGLWVGIVASIVTLIVFVLEYGPKIWGAKAMLGAAYPKISAVLLIVAFCLSAFSIYLWMAKQPGTAPEYKKWSSTKNETISRRSYFNETVEIDGKTFDHCEFTNVKFIYYGLAETTFLESKLSGTIFLETDNQAAKGFTKLATYFRNNLNLTSFAVGEIDASTGKIIVMEQTTRENVGKKGAKPKP